MRFKKALPVIMIFLISLLTSCVNRKTNLEGGEDGRIRGYYQFNNYEEFSFFYGCFKENNVERYLVINDINKEFTIEYAFLSEGMLKKDFDAKQYNITYPNQTMFLNLWVDNIEIRGTCFNVNSLQNISTLNLKYEIKECSNKTYELILMTEENYNVFKAIVKYSSETLELSEFCEKIVYEFENGII